MAESRLLESRLVAQLLQSVRERTFLICALTLKESNTQAGIPNLREIYPVSLTEGAILSPGLRLLLFCALLPLVLVGIYFIQKNRVFYTSSQANSLCILVCYFSLSRQISGFPIDHWPCHTSMSSGRGGLRGICMRFIRECRSIIKGLVTQVCRGVFRGRGWTLLRSSLRRGWLWGLSRVFQQ